MNLFNFRNEYKRGHLDETTVEASPIDQFKKWFIEAVKKGEREPTGMIIATSTRDGNPSARMVLMKEFSERGFTFFTSYNSKKGIHLSENHYAALVFHWPKTERQVRIEGRVEKLPAHESDKYFDSRPEGSKISAIVSQQSHIVSDWSVIEEVYKKAFSDFKGKRIPRPAEWGGYLVKPYLIEFWQGRPNRLHDRIEYHYNGEKWVIRRLAP
jgi:pyridoxamine 5'-phosphate oxidase